MGYRDPVHIPPPQKIRMEITLTTTTQSNKKLVLMINKYFMQYLHKKVEEPNIIHLAG